MTLCDYMADNGDWGPDLYTDKEVRARKAHRCDECLGSIEAGTTYRRVVGLWDGRFATFRTCRECLDGPAGFAMRNCGGYVHTALREYLVEWTRDGGAPTAAVETLVAGWVAAMDARRAALGEGT